MIKRLFKNSIQLLKKHKYKFALVGLVLVIWYYFCLPNPLFSDPVSTALEDRNGELLGARIAADGQWRFPKNDSVPEKFQQAIKAFEDKRFENHFGVDPLAMLRALYLNLKSGSVVSGGSTLTMQTIRLARKGKSRTVFEKFIEVILATRLEFRHSKPEIMALYASNAPFGGNVVGLDAAAWKYYGRNPKELSWSESATLAVLPNAPALIHPGRNRYALKQKRDKLIDKLAALNLLDSTSAYLAKIEKLPARPMPLPNISPHLTDRIQQQQKWEQKKEGKEKSVVKTTLNSDTQKRVNAVMARQYAHLRQNGIYNGGALVIEVATGDVLAYVGNMPTESDEEHGAVDVTKAPRSTGSIIKPLLYANMLQTAELLPDMLVSDVPSSFGGYSPKNYDLEYDGILPASEALSRSLNVPFVQMLSRHGVPRFHDFLKKAGITTLTNAPQHYGLSLILGGAEVSLEDLAGVYSSMARGLGNFQKYNGKYEPDNFRPINYLLAKSKPTLERENYSKLQDKTVISASATWHTFKSMLEVVRPGEEGYWRNFLSSNRVAWKTGTSFGFRDAWAAGCTPKYVVAVWVGNASGEGRQGLTGVTAAAPVLFDIFNTLPRQTEWFEMPYDELKEVSVCRTSGYRASEICPVVDSAWVQLEGLRTKPCPYHKTVFLDKSAEFQVHSDCENPSDMLKVPYFILPPSQEAYYKNKNPNYELLPPYRPDCLASLVEKQMQTMELVYPKFSTRIYVPTNLDGTLSSVVFEVAHRAENTKIYWHLDEQFIGETQEFHQLALNPTEGKHKLVLVDENGERLERGFEVLGKTE
ncbi:MAG: penicillin-binding protein 1C [Flammeovirgaceae bacterium]|jgi:penicillin-binding protein 1C